MIVAVVLFFVRPWGLRAAFKFVFMVRIPVLRAGFSGRSPLHEGLGAAGQQAFNVYVSRRGLCLTGKERSDCDASQSL